MAKRAKDPVKQRAGILGARVRWRRLLRWIEKLRELRGGTFEVEWDPSPEQWREKLDMNSSQMNGLRLLYVANWRAHKGKIPREARADMERLVAQTGLEDTVAMLAYEQGRGLQDAVWRGLKAAVWMSVGGRNSSKPPWLHVRWSYATLKLKLRVTDEEEKELKHCMKCDQAESKPKPSDLRLPKVLRALADLRKNKQRPSLRNVQSVLRERYGITTGLATIRKDLATLRKDLPN